MKVKFYSCLFSALVLLAGVGQAAAQGTPFFRMAGSAATTITAFRPDGTMVWSNAHPSLTYTVQSVSSLSGGTNWVDYLQLATSNAVNTNQLVDFSPPAGLELIPAGVFTMGNSTGDTDFFDASPLIVTVSAFYMDSNLISYSQWQSVYDWATNHGYGFDHAGSGAGTNQPAQMMNWYDAVKWSNARSQQGGLAPAYYTDANLTQVYTNGDVDSVFVNWTVDGYRLPTEAEWEKAARGGLIGLRFPWGNTISQSQANYDGDTGSGGFGYDLGPNGYNAAFTNGSAQPSTSPVGYFAGNGYGLYDMAGNVHEWCWDWYGFYGQPTSTNPTGPATGAARVLRGGGWDGSANYARCAFRSYGAPSVGDADAGIRCVRRH